MIWHTFLRELLKAETNHETHEISRKMQLLSIGYRKKVITKILSCFFVFFMVKKEFLEVAMSETIGISMLINSE
jgi:uncharacterized membrane protein